MCILYGISFFFSLGGIFGVGHLFAGAPSKAIGYFIAGVLWAVLATVTGLASGGTALLCFIPLHLIFAHFCSADAVRIARGNETQALA
jgi:hypothetical protein